MKRFLGLFLILLFLMPVSASDYLVGLDLRCIDSAFMRALRIDAEASYRFDKVRVTIPLRYSHSYDYEFDFAETGLLVSVYPFEGYGFFAGVSLVRLGAFWGLEAPADRFMFFSEAVVGWTFEFPYFYIEPRFSMTDFFSSQEEKLNLLAEAVPQYSKFRISLIAGTAF